MQHNLFILVFDKMRRFIIRITVLLVLLAFVDSVAGYGLEFLRDRCHGKDFGKMNHILNKCSEDVLIFGSSRAYHHYSPKIFNNVMGMSCYNCGQDASGILLMSQIFNKIHSRYRPQCVIYDIMPGFDLFKEDDNVRYLEWLKPYYDNSMKELFNDIKKEETYKIHSKLYRYNSCFVRIIFDYLGLLPNNDYNGYVQLNGHNERNMIEIAKEEYSYDSLKLSYMERFIRCCVSNKIPLIFTYSPMYDGIDKNAYLPLSSLCNKYHIPLIDMSNDTAFLGKKRYFKDGFHLNKEGSELYSEKIAETIKDILSKSKQ